MKRVLLLTSHPLAAPWDSADKQIAFSIAHRIDDFRFTVFGRAGHALDLSATRMPVWSRDGRPGMVERAQAMALGLALEPTVDLIHAVLSIGPGFRRFSAARRVLPKAIRRPVIHTVPGVLSPGFLTGTRPAGLTVALSHSTAAQLRSAGFGDVRVVPPGIPLDRWPQREAASDDPPVVLFAGHYDPGGGAEDAIRGVAAAAQRGQPARLVLAMRTRFGQDEASAAAGLRLFAQRSGVEAVEVLGHVRDMPALIQRSSVVVFPATSLSGKADVPLFVLEAMATGRGVVMSDLPVFSSLVDSVIRIPPGDAEALGQAITLLLRDRALWTRHVAAGRRLVEERFSDAAMAARYAALYRELLAMRAA